MVERACGIRPLLHLKRPNQTKICSEIIREEKRGRAAAESWSIFNLQPAVLKFVNEIWEFQESSVSQSVCCKCVCVVCCRCRSFQFQWKQMKRWRDILWRWRHNRWQQRDEWTDDTPGSHAEELKHHLNCQMPSCQRRHGDGLNPFYGESRRVRARRDTHTPLLSSVFALRFAYSLRSRSAFPWQPCVTGKKSQQPLLPAFSITASDRPAASLCDVAGGRAANGAVPAELINKHMASQRAAAGAAG